MYNDNQYYDENGQPKFQPRRAQTSSHGQHQQLPYYDGYGQPVHPSNVYPNQMTPPERYHSPQRSWSAHDIGALSPRSAATGYGHSGSAHSGTLVPYEHRSLESHPPSYDGYNAEYAHNSSNHKGLDTGPYAPNLYNPHNFDQKKLDQSPWGPLLYDPNNPNNPIDVYQQIIESHEWPVRLAPPANAQSAPGTRTRRETLEYDQSEHAPSRSSRRKQIEYKKSK